MDLKECKDTSLRRHPWETARLKAVQRILAPYAFEGIKVLDLGCGDGFVAGRLFSHLAEKEITAVDIYLSDALLQELGDLQDGVHYCRELPEHGRYDLLLLLDVIEHQEDDRGFLAGLVARQVVGGGKVLITAPAFQSLFSSHDAFLNHYRRYTLLELMEIATTADLKVVASGYLFLSLLLPKFILFKLLKPDGEPDGVGNWRWGSVVTTLFTTLLEADNRLLQGVGGLGIKLPGLTGWVLCEKPE